MGLSLTAIQEKNKLGTDSVFAVLLDIEIPGVTEHITITSNGEDIIWDGVTWMAFPFEIGELNEDGKGEVPQWEIKLDNKQRVIEKYLQDYDQYLKTYGIEGNEIKCSCHVVNTKDLANPETVKTVYFELSQPTTTPENATFILTADSPFNIVAPKRKFIKTFCYWKFKGVECGYNGVQTECDKTLTRCKQLGNSTRFGGFPGVGQGGIRL
jgi:lambda family phage minor tail protein L